MDQIPLIFKDLTPATKKFLADPALKSALDEALRQLINEPPNMVVPEIPLVLNALRLCPIESARVLLLGQDPYLHRREATGLSFSVSRGVKLPPSLRNIYLCLRTQGLMHGEPTHGDLSSWATQGVLMLNVTLTTLEGRSRAHDHIWKKFSEALLRKILTEIQPVVIALGKFAQGKIEELAPKGVVVLSWGHPSPMNAQNQTDGRFHFKNCDVFTRVNQIINPPIKWDSVIDNVVPTISESAVIDIGKDPGKDLGKDHVTSITTTSNSVTTSITPSEPYKHTLYMPPSDSSIAPEDIQNAVWIFTDGAATDNGKKTCRASWAYRIVNGNNAVTNSGMVDNPATSQRGELTALLMALEHMNTMTTIFHKFVIVTDSEYMCRCVCDWHPGWDEKARKKKKNLDLLDPICAKVTALSRRGRVIFCHVNSHKPKPTGALDTFLWEGNDAVDCECEKKVRET